MPNHVHGIIVLVDDDRRGGSAHETDEAHPVTGLLRGQDYASEQTHPYVPDPTHPYVPPDLAHQQPPNRIVRHGLPEIVRAFKSFSARRINAILRSPGKPVWQRNYYEHIIRNQVEYQRIRDYILTNPARWQTDSDYRPRRDHR